MATGYSDKVISLADDIILAKSKQAEEIAKAKGEVNQYTREKKEKDIKELTEEINNILNGLKDDARGEFLTNLSIKINENVSQFIGETGNVDIKIFKEKVSVIKDETIKVVEAQSNGIAEDKSTKNKDQTLENGIDLNKDSSKKEEFKINFDEIKKQADEYINNFVETSLTLEEIREGVENFSNLNLYQKLNVGKNLEEIKSPVEKYNAYNKICTRSKDELKDIKDKKVREKLSTSFEVIQEMNEFNKQLHDAKSDEEIGEILKRVSECEEKHPEVDKSLFLTFKKSAQAIIDNKSQKGNENLQDEYFSKLFSNKLNDFLVNTIANSVLVIQAQQEAYKNRSEEEIKYDDKFITELKNIREKNKLFDKVLQREFDNNSKLREKYPNEREAMIQFLKNHKTAFKKLGLKDEMKELILLDKNLNREEEKEGIRIVDPITKTFRTLKKVTGSVLKGEKIQLFDKSQGLDENKDESLRDIIKRKRVERREKRVKRREEREAEMKRAKSINDTQYVKKKTAFTPEEIDVSEEDRFKDSNQEAEPENRRDVGNKKIHTIFNVGDFRNVAQNEHSTNLRKISSHIKEILGNNSKHNERHTVTAPSDNERT